MGFFSVSKLIWFAFAPSHLLAWMCIASRNTAVTKYDRLGRRLSIASARSVRFDRHSASAYVADPAHWKTSSRASMAFSRRWRVDSWWGVEHSRSRSRDAPAMELSEARLVSTYELARLYPNAPHHILGGSGQLGGHQAPRGASGQIYFGQMGLETGRLTFEDRSHNTWENILYSQKIAKPRRGEVWLLATSAISCREQWVWQSV